MQTDAVLTKSYMCSGRQLLLSISSISHSSDVQPGANHQEWSPVTNSYYDSQYLQKLYVVLELADKSIIVHNAILEYLNVCVRAFRDIDWMLQIFYNRYVISDFKSTPVRTTFNQQRLGATYPLI
jgi:hypothetical protein